MSNPNSMFLIEVGVVHGNKKFSFSTTRHPMLILELSQEPINLIVVALLKPTKKIWSDPGDRDKGDGHFHQ